MIDNIAMVDNGEMKTFARIDDECTFSHYETVKDIKGYFQMQNYPKCMNGYQLNLLGGTDAEGGSQHDN